MRVIVTRPAAEAADWVTGLRAAGFDVVALPLIDISPVPDPAPMHAAWHRLAAYRAAMFVSANAVRGFFDARPAGATFDTRAWATGAGTVGALTAAGVDGAWIDAPPADALRFDSEALWEIVRSQVRAGDRVLLVRGGEAGEAEPAGRDWLEQRVLAQRAQPEQVLAYLRAPPALSAGQLRMAQAAASDGSAWLFSSSQAIANLIAQLPSVDWTKAMAVATHPRIAQSARDAGFAVVRVSRPPMDAVIGDLESLG
jgi:uroporphyrinogen-III synthase